MSFLQENAVQGFSVNLPASLVELVMKLETQFPQTPVTHVKVNGKYLLCCIRLQCAGARKHMGLNAHVVMIIAYDGCMQTIPLCCGSFACNSCCMHDYFKDTEQGVQQWCYLLD